mgnify:CR=1 FL=1
MCAYPLAAQCTDYTKDPAGCQPSTFDTPMEKLPTVRVNAKGEVDPTMPVYPEKGKEFKEHHIPGLEHLAKADLVIFFPRLLTLPMAERELIVKYVDSGKPIIALRTANHGFHGALPYKIDGKQVNWGEDVLGGSFRGHHGRYHADSTRGLIVEALKDHPILSGVSDIWGNSDVYRTYKDMDAGAGSGLGRLEKAEIQEHKPRKAGGRTYRSYKDMDAGAGSGLGRKEKTEIQKHK